MGGLVQAELGYLCDSGGVQILYYVLTFNEHGVPKSK